MNNKKLIKRCKAGDTVEKSDNTRVQMPRTDVEHIYYEPAAIAEQAASKQPQSGAITPVYPEFELLMGLRGAATTVGKRATKSGNAFRITADNLADVTDEMWDEAYNAAIANNDLAEAQRLRDLHFKAKAPNTKIVDAAENPLHVYHGTKNNFNVFDNSKFGNTDGGTFGKGIYTTPSKEYANLYGDNVLDLYLNLENPRNLRNVTPRDIYLSKMEAITNGLDPDYMYTGIDVDGVWGSPSWKGKSFADEIVSHSNKKLKLADAVTHADDGTVIPLSKRDNFLNPDIRYSWLLPIGLTTTFGLPYAVNYNDQK